MSEVTLKIDDKEVKAEKDMTVLDAIKSAGIDIPTLCYHPGLSPAGVCRLCSVEAIKQGRSRIVVSCSYPVEEGLVVNTKSPKVIEIRKMLLELMLARSPNVKVIQDLAKEYGIEKPRFRLEEEKCILCGLCQRVCEKIGQNVINFVGRGVGREVKTPYQMSADANLDICMACGGCVSICPTGAMDDTFKESTMKKPIPIPSEFEMGLTSRKPIYVPFPQALPNIPTIDRSKCAHFVTDQCRICEEVCEPKAINFDQKEETVELEVGSIIIATGFKTFDPHMSPRYGYGIYPNVYTSLEVERLLNASGPTSGEVVLRNSGKPSSVGIIHCIGSRDENTNVYCSKVCCMYSLKLAHIIKERTGAEVYNFYTDIRTPGKGFEEFYNKILEEGVHFIRGKVGEVTDHAIDSTEEGKLVIRVEDTLMGVVRRIPVDMVVLAVGLEPQADAVELGKLLNIQCSSEGFFMERHPKMAPVETFTDGIFLAGACQGPKDIPDTIAQANAAAAQALALIDKGHVELEPNTAYVDEDLCSGCKVCIPLCPYSAISFDESKQKVEIQGVLCKGCGACVSACPSGALGQNLFELPQIMGEIKGITRVLPEVKT